MKSQNKAVWDGSDIENAKKYDEYTKRFSVYSEIGKNLIDLAGVKEGMTVADLGCGTGVATEKLLTAVGASGKVYAVDSSPAMLEIARSRIKAPHVVFICSFAEELDLVLKEKVDCVVSSAAFWQMDMNKKLEVVEKILKNGGNFAFNMPAQFLGPLTTTLPKKEVVGNLPQLMQQAMRDIAVREYKIPNYIYMQKKLTFKDVEKILESNSFAVVRRESITSQRTIEDIYEFNKIPIITETLLSPLDYEKRMDVLNKAYVFFNKNKKHLDTWTCFIVEKRS